MSFQNEDDWAASMRRLTTGLKAEGVALEAFTRALDTPWFVSHVSDAVRLANSMMPQSALILTDEKVKQIASIAVTSEAGPKIRSFIMSGRAL